MKKKVARCQWEYLIFCNRFLLRVNEEVIKEVRRKNSKKFDYRYFEIDKDFEEYLNHYFVDEEDMKNRAMYIPLIMFYYRREKGLE